MNATKCSAGLIRRSSSHSIDKDAYRKLKTYTQLTHVCHEKPMAYSAAESTNGDHPRFHKIVSELPKFLTYHSVGVYLAVVLSSIRRPEKSRNFLSILQLSQCTPSCTAYMRHTQRSRLIIPYICVPIILVQELRRLYMDQNRYT
jgi:hypothetical protein